jgi:hypothetical protein
MTNLSKLVWSEGMYLGPHHFQAQARYFEDSMHFLASALSFAPYGLIGCGLDDEALRNGTVSVLHARGIFPDGLVFYMPESDPLPEARPIADAFSPIASSLTIYLGISRYDADAPNFSGVDGVRTDARFVSETQNIADETTGSGDKRVQIARKNIRLFLESEVTAGTVAMPIGRVLRDGSGEFVYDSGFIPPTLQISGSARLMSILERLIEILEEKHQVLAPKGISSGSLAPPVLLHPHASGRVVCDPGPAGGFPVHVCDGCESERNSSLQPRQAFGVLRVARRVHPKAPGIGDSHQLRQRAVRIAGRLHLRWKRARQPLLRAFTVGFVDSIVRA